MTEIQKGKAQGVAFGDVSLLMGETPIPHFSRGQDAYGTIHAWS